MDQQRHDYLAKEIAKNIEWFDKESTLHKRLHRKLRYSVFGLTALASALSGVALAMPDIQIPMNVAIVLATVDVGVVTSIEGLRKPSELWIHERTILYSLKDLERDLNYRSNGQVDLAVEDDVYDRLQQVLGSARERWGRQIAGKSVGVPESAAIARSATQ